MSKNPSDNQIRGQGDDLTAGRSDNAERTFVKDGPVKQKGRRSIAGEATPGHGGGEAKLDDRLKGTFPASDPPSASPGSD